MIFIKCNDEELSNINCCLAYERSYNKIYPSSYFQELQDGDNYTTLHTAWEVIKELADNHRNEGGLSALKALEFNTMIRIKLAS